MNKQYTIHTLSNITVWDHVVSLYSLSLICIMAIVLSLQKMCIYSSIDYVLDFNLSIRVSSYFYRDCNISFSLPETRPFVCKFPEPK